MTTAEWPGLPSGIKSRHIRVGDLDIHILEALPPTADPSSKPPLLLLLHGFPELAYSWRKIMVPLSSNGYTVVAPDLRGFGQTIQLNRSSKSKQVAFDEDLSPYRILNIAADIVALVYSLGYTSVEAVIGHDFGSPVAAHAALIRPDVFRSVVLMSAPFTGPPTLSTIGSADTTTNLRKLDGALGSLDPPRKHYMVYFSTPQAAQDVSNPPQGLHRFLRTYYHTKSADWKPNMRVRPLGTVPTPSAFAELPPYYIMPRDKTMPEALASEEPVAEEVAQNTWLPDEELGVYVSQYAESGFQGGLNHYRCLSESTKWIQDLNIFVGKQIEIPAMFISGAQDWGTFQFPGAAETMRKQACKNMREEDFVLIDGAGHWVQQEKPAAVVEHIIRFVKERLGSSS